LSFQYWKESDWSKDYARHFCSFDFPKISLTLVTQENSLLFSTLKPHLTGSSMCAVCSSYRFVSDFALGRCIVSPVKPSTSVGTLLPFASIIFHTFSCRFGCYSYLHHLSICLKLSYIFLLNFVTFDFISTVWDCLCYGFFSAPTISHSFINFVCIKVDFLLGFGLFGWVFVRSKAQLNFYTLFTNDQNACYSYCKIAQRPIAFTWVMYGWFFECTHAFTFLYFIVSNCSDRAGFPCFIEHLAYRLAIVFFPFRITLYLRSSDSIR
jgi:hypothetical protein